MVTYVEPWNRSSTCEDWSVKCWVNPRSSSLWELFFLTMKWFRREYNIVEFDYLPMDIVHKNVMLNRAIFEAAMVCLFTQLTASTALWLRCGNEVKYIARGFTLIQGWYPNKHTISISRHLWHFYQASVFFFRVTSAKFRSAIRPSRNASLCPLSLTTKLNLINLRTT